MGRGTGFIVAAMQADLCFDPETKILTVTLAGELNELAYVQAWLKTVAHPSFRADGAILVDMSAVTRIGIHYAAMETFHRGGYFAEGARTAMVLPAGLLSTGLLNYIILSARPRTVKTFPNKEAAMAWLVG